MHLQLRNIETGVKKEFIVGPDEIRLLLNVAFNSGVKWGK